MKIFIADDSILFRKVMAEVLSALPDTQVVGQAPNGKLAVQKIKDLRPDLVTLDMEMPEMDGLAVLDALQLAGNMPLVIVVSSLTKHGGKLTIQALNKGAFDFITKPNATSSEQSRAMLHADLAPRIKAASLRLNVREILQKNAQKFSKEQPKPVISVAAMNGVSNRMARLTGIAKPEMVLIGVSTGGPNALAVLLPDLPKMGVPIFIVQHMPPLFTQTLAENLSGKCVLGVREAVDGEIAKADTVYIAPGGRHMRIASDQNGNKIIQITEDPPENNCRPSVDYLFRSVAHQFPGRAMGVILTGMGNDGTLGLKLLKRHSCFVIAQDEASCVVYGMPKSAVEAGVTDEVLPLESIAGRIKAVICGGSA